MFSKLLSIFAVLLITILSTTSLSFASDYHQIQNCIQGVIAQLGDLEEHIDHLEDNKRAIERKLQSVLSHTDDIVAKERIANVLKSRLTRLDRAIAKLSASELAAKFKLSELKHASSTCTKGIVFAAACFFFNDLCGTASAAPALRRGPAILGTLEGYLEELEELENLRTTALADLERIKREQPNSTYAINFASQRVQSINGQIELVLEEFAEEFSQEDLDNYFEALESYSEEVQREVAKLPSGSCSSPIEWTCGCQANIGTPSWQQLIIDPHPTEERLAANGDYYVQLAYGREAITSDANLTSQSCAGMTHDHYQRIGETKFYVGEGQDSYTSICQEGGSLSSLRVALLEESATPDFPGGWANAEGTYQCIPAGFPKGDANMNGLFDTTDLVQVFQGGCYEKSCSSPGWQLGDFNGDGLVTSRDLLDAFRESGMPQ